MKLALDDQRVEHVATIVDGDKLLDRHAPGLSIDRHHGNGRADPSCRMRSAGEASSRAAAASSNVPRTVTAAGLQWLPPSAPLRLPIVSPPRWPLSVSP
jgi:hypothetical protein